MALELVAREILEIGDLQKFEEFLVTNAENIEINFLFDEQVTFLMILVQTFRKMQSLIIDRNEKAPVEDYKSTITFLVHAGCDVNKQDNLGRTVCHWTILLEALELLSVCLSLGYDTLIQDNEGQTIVHLAIRHMDHRALETIKLYGISNSVLEATSSASGATPLIYAVQIGAVDIARKLLQLSVNVNQQEDNKYRRTALHYALFIDNEEIFELLLKNGAKTDIKDSNGKSVLDRVAEHSKDSYLRTVTHYSSAAIFVSGDQTTTTGYSPIMTACKNNDYDMVCELLAGIPEDNEEELLKIDSDQRTALHYCADITDERCAKKLIDRAPTLMTIKDKNGFTALHLATISNNVNLVRMLLGNGCEITEQDNEGHTSLHWAVVCGSMDIIDILITKEPTIVHIGDRFGASPLHYATQSFLNPDGANQGPRVMEELLKHKETEIDCLDVEHRSPLQWAACLGLSGCCQILLEKGANQDQRNDRGLTVLHCAASRGHYDIVELLVNLWSMYVDDEDNNLCTPLFYAVTLRHTKIIEFLIEKRCDLNHQDIKGRTVVHCAALKGFCDVLSLICDAGGSVCLQNKEGDLPLHEAVEAGRLDVCELLIDKMKENNELHHINTTNNAGYTCLHKAAQCNRSDICQLLLENGASPDILVSLPGEDNVMVTPRQLATEVATTTMLENAEEIFRLKEPKKTSLEQKSPETNDTDVQKEVDLPIGELEEGKKRLRKGKASERSSNMKLIPSLGKVVTIRSGKIKVKKENVNGNESNNIKITLPRAGARPLLPLNPMKTQSHRITGSNSAKSSQLNNDSGTVSSGSSITTPASSISFRHEAKPPDLHTKIINSVREYDKLRDRMRSLSDQRRMEMFEGFAKAAKLSILSGRTTGMRSSKNQKYSSTDKSSTELPQIEFTTDRKTYQRQRNGPGSTEEQIKSAYHCDLTLSTLIIQ